MSSEKRLPQRNMRISDKDYKSLRRAAERYQRLTGASKPSIVRYLLDLHRNFEWALLEDRKNGH